MAEGNAGAEHNGDQDSYKSYINSTRGRGNSRQREVSWGSRASRPRPPQRACGGHVPGTSGRDATGSFAARGPVGTRSAYPTNLRPRAGESPPAGASRASRVFANPAVQLIEIPL